MARLFRNIVISPEYDIWDILLGSVAGLELIAFHMGVFELSDAGTSGARADTTIRKALARLLKSIESQTRSQIDCFNMGKSSKSFKRTMNLLSGCKSKFISRNVRTSVVAWGEPVAPEYHV